MAADADNNTQPPADPPADNPPADDWTPPTKEEHERMQRALAKANAEAKDWRTKHKALADQHGSDADKAAREQAEAAEKRYKPVAVRAAAKAAFLEAGLQGATPDRVAKLVRMLDLDSLDIDDSGDVSGLADQVASIKKDYPELFAPADKRPPRVSAGDKPPANNGSAKRSSDLIAAQVLGG